MKVPVNSGQQITVSEIMHNLSSDSSPYQGNNMPKISHIAPNSYFSRNESCENNNMGTKLM